MRRKSLHRSTSPPRLAGQIEAVSKAQRGGWGGWSAVGSGKPGRIESAGLVLAPSHLQTDKGSDGGARERVRLQLLFSGVGGLFPSPSGEDLCFSPALPLHWPPSGPGVSAVPRSDTAPKTASSPLLPPWFPRRSRLFLTSWGNTLGKGSPPLLLGPSLPKSVSWQQFSLLLPPLGRKRRGLRANGVFFHLACEEQNSPSCRLGVEGEARLCLLSTVSQRRAPTAQPSRCFP